MSKFIKYENIDFRINSDVFYSKSVGISLNSNVSPILLSDGSLLRYAPENTIIGSLSTEFYLTGALPSYLEPTSSSESFIPCSFAGVNIDNCYIKSLSFEVSNFSTVLIKVDFDWFGNINTENSTARLRPLSANRNGPLSNTAHANQTYLMDVDNVFGFTEIFNFSYSEKVDRLPFFANGEIVPFRVAKTNKIKSMSVEGNYFKKTNVANIAGTSTYCDLYLKDYENNLLKKFNISGVIESRSLNTSTDGLLQSTLSITQRLAPLRNSL
jgi:hypothetical protein